jgi:outer membrane protein TolC
MIDRISRFPAFAVVLFLVCGPIAGQEGEPRSLQLTIDEALAGALVNDRSLAAGRSLTDAASHARAAAELARLPQLTIEGRYARIEEQDPPEVDIPGAPISIGTSFDDATAFDLSVAQPLYLGGALSARVAQSTALFDAETLEQDRRRRLVSLEIRRAYWRLLEADLRRDAFRERLDQVSANLRTMEERFSEGLVTRNEVLTVEMRLARAELDLINAENALALASADVAMRIGVDADTRIVVASELPDRPVSVPELETFVASALADRPDLAAMRRRTAAQDAAVVLARSELLPEVYVTGRYTYARPNDALFPPPDRFEDSWQIGVLGRISLGSAPSSVSRTREASSRRDAHVEEVAALENRIRLAVRGAYLSWESSGQQVRLGRTMVRQAEENLANTAVRVEAGAALNEDLLDAQVDLLEARLALTSAVVGREVSWLELMYASAMEM